MQTSKKVLAYTTMCIFVFNTTLDAATCIVVSQISFIIVHDLLTRTFKCLRQIYVAFSTLKTCTLVHLAQHLHLLPGLLRSCET